MNTLALILWIFAAVLFTVAAFVPPFFGRLIGLGLALFVIGDMVQWGAKSHSITF